MEFCDNIFNKNKLFFLFNLQTKTNTYTHREKCEGEEEEGGKIVYEKTKQQSLIINENLNI